MTTETTQVEGKKKGGFVKWALIVAIVIVLNMFFNYAISLAYKSPKYEDFIKTTQVVTPISNKEECLKVGGQWTDPSPYTNTDIKAQGTKFEAPVGYCDPNFTNQKKIDNALKNYNRNVFIVLVVLGIASIIVGGFVANEIISPSFSWGGVLSLLIASMRYWGDANDLFKVIILAMALGVLIWFAVKKFGK